MSKEIQRRYALWKAHDEQCAYTHEWVDFENVEIEHIIPKCEKQLSMKIQKYDLGSDFDLDSLDNLLPVKRKLNGIKGKKPFDESHERFFLQMAKRKKPLVEKKLRDIQAKVENTDQTIIGSWGTDECNDLIFKLERYKETRTVLERDTIQTTHHYWNSKPDVAINGFLPSRFDEDGSCLIDFRNSDIQMSLNSQSIQDMIKTLHTKGESEFLRSIPVPGKTDVILVYLLQNAIFLRKSVFEQFQTIFADYLQTYWQYYLVSKISSGRRV